jgi:hypothetical protein
LDLVACSLGPCLPGGTSPGEAVQAYGSLSTMDPGVTELGFPSYPGMPSPPVSWKQMEGSAEHTCLWVPVVDRLLREAMAMVGRDILHPIQVNLKRRKGLPKFLLFPLGSLTTPSFCFCASFIPRHR